MGTYKQVILLFSMMIMVGSSVMSSAISQANSCSADQQAVSEKASASCIVADSDSLNLATQTQSPPIQHQAEHCHCVSQTCCGFLIVPIVSLFKIDSKETTVPLVNASPCSWITVPPTRPPSV